MKNTELAEARKLYLDRHANSKYWVDFEDFSFYRMNVVDVYYIGGFGVMGWVSASDYGRSQADPLADSMAEIRRNRPWLYRSCTASFRGVESEKLGDVAILGTNCKGTVPGVTTYRILRLPGKW